MYTAIRNTGDLDIWLNPTKKNAEKILQAVNEFGFGSFKLTVADFTTTGNVIQLGYPPLRIDLLNEIDGVEFIECFKNKEVITIQGLQINFISYSDLLKNKKSSGRHKDLDDLENLER